jgi:hypothetical protein
MRLRIILIGLGLLAGLSMARLHGRVCYDGVGFSLHIPAGGYYRLAAGPTLWATAGMFALLGLGAFSAGFRRGARALARRFSRWAAPAAFVSLIALSYYEANWYWAPRSRVLLSLGFGGLACVLGPRRLRLGLARRWVALADRGGRMSLGAAACVVGLAGFVALMAFKVFYYADVPMTGDGASSLFQAYILAQGHLKLPSPEFPDFFTGTGIQVYGGWYAMYPPAHAALLALGVRLGAPWLIGPLSGAVTAALVWLIGARWFGRRCATVAAGLLMTSPHWLAMSPSYMTHTSASLWLTVALAALAFSDEPKRAGRLGLLGGVALGLACASRPATGLFGGAPYAVAFVCLQARRPRGARVVALALAGALFIGALFMLYNWGTTGDPLVTGYQENSSKHWLGFGGAGGHTPAIGLLQTLNNLWAFSFWGPGCFPGALALLGLWFISTRFAWRETTLAAAWLALPVTYFFYYYQDFALGPRFLFEIGPPTALLCARGLESALERFADGMPGVFRRRLSTRTFVAAGLGLALGGVFVSGNVLLLMDNIAFRNRTFMANLRDFESKPESVIFVDNVLQGISVAENLRHPEGPLFLQHRGEERNRQYMAAHPEREYFFRDPSGVVPYEQALPETRQ